MCRGANHASTSVEMGINENTGFSRSLICHHKACKVRFNALRPRESGIAGLLALRYGRSRRPAVSP